MQERFSKTQLQQMHVEELKQEELNKIDGGYSTGWWQRLLAILRMAAAQSSSSRSGGDSGGPTVTVPTPGRPGS
jgi:hypothetical protein